MKTLWARIGMSVRITDEEEEQVKTLLNNDKKVEAREMLLDLFLSRGYIDGDSYLPSNHNDGCNDNPNEDDIDLMED